MGQGSVRLQIEPGMIHAGEYFADTAAKKKIGGENFAAERSLRLYLSHLL